MKRLIFVDALRGLFIFYALIVHSVGNVVFKADLNSIDSINPVVVVILLPLIWFGTWAPLFAFLSGIANVYVAYNIMAKDSSDEALKKIIKGIAFNSIIILLIHYFNQLLLHNSLYYNDELVYTLLTGYVETGVWKFYPKMLYYTEAMHIIALSGLILSLVLFLLWRKGGFKKRKRNYIILGTLGMIILFISPILHNILEPILYSQLDNGKYFNALILKTFIGPRQSTFPNVANALFGGIFGMMLSEELDLKTIRKYGGVMGSFFVIFDLIVLIPILGFEFSDLFLHDLPITVYLMNLGLQILSATFLIGRMEYSSEKQRSKSAKRSIWLRRFGLMALTTYMFESIVAQLLGKLYVQLWPTNPFPSNIIAILLFIFIIVMLWTVLLKVWEKFNFKYSLEWFVANLVGRVRGRKSSRLQVQSVLYDAIQIPKESVEESPFFLIPTEELSKTELEFIAYKLKLGIDQLKENFEEGIDHLRDLLKIVSEKSKKEKELRKMNKTVKPTVKNISDIAE